MSINYSNAENGLSKAKKNGFFPRHFFAYDWNPDFGFSGFKETEKWLFKTLRQPNPRNRARIYM